MKQGQKVIWTTRDTINVVRYGSTSNPKIIGNPKQKIVQTYHISRRQFELVRSGLATAGTLQAKEHTEANCLDCPMRGNGCYVDKGMQALGLLSMVKSIVNQYGMYDNIPTEPDWQTIVDMCTGTYVRFGTYGEPVRLAFPLVADMAEVASSYTGYTHQWGSPFFQSYKRYFMASTDDSTRFQAEASGWREFTMTSHETNKHKLVRCPASKEGGNKTNCAKCGLCSGTLGKGKKSVIIIQH